MTADVDDEAAFGRCASAFAPKSVNDMQRSWRFAVDELDPRAGATAASGVAMKVFDGQRTTSPRTSANASAASAAPAQPAKATAGQAVARRPGRLERRREAALGPPLGVDDLVPERVQTRAVTVIEADCEPIDRGH